MKRTTCIIGLLVLGTHLFRVAADPLDQWLWRNPLPTGNVLEAITYANGTFVSVGAGGAIAFSMDGTNWLSRFLGPIYGSGTNYGLGGIAWGNGIWVAVGNLTYPEIGNIPGGGLPVLLTSPDLTTWTQMTPPQDANSLAGIVYADGLFVAVGSGYDPISQLSYGFIMTSEDGVHWTEQNSGTNDTSLNNIIYGNGLFVVDGSYSSTLLTSPDGVNWTVHQAGVQNWDSSTGMTYADGLYVVVGPPGILVSPDGSRWTNLVSWTNAQTVTYADGRFIAVSSDGQIQSSTNGLKWIQSGTLGVSSILDLIYGNGTFVGVGLATLVVSTNGTNWDNLDSSVTTAMLEGVAYGQGTFVAVGWSATILYSKNGAQWTAAITDLDPNSVSLDAVAYGGGTFVAADATGIVLASTNGIDWVTVTNAGNGLSSITYGKGRFVAVGSSGVIVTSTNGSNWAVQDSGTTSTLTGLAYGNGLFVASTSRGFLTSPDGVDWTEQNFNETNAYVDGLAYGNGVFVAVATTGLILSSTDGTNWATNSSGTIADLYCVAYGGGTFMVAGDAGTIQTSTNGTNWVSRNSGTLNYLFGTAFGQGTFIVVGTVGTILQSGVLPSPVAVLNPSSGLVNGVFAFSLSAPLGGQWQVQASTDLLNWTSLGTLTITNTPLPFVDTGATNFQQRFYRTVSP
jgi:hypothetical protein